MRVYNKTRAIFLPHIVSLEEFHDVEAPEQSNERLYDSLTDTLFRHIKPGAERTCIYLRADDLQYDEIGFIIGKPKIFVAQTIYNVRERLLKENLLTKR